MPNTLKSTLNRIRRTYQGDAERPLGGYLLVLGAYGGTVAGLAGLGRACGYRPPSTVPTKDLVLLFAATHKLARLLAKDAVTSPLRAPLTRFEEPAGEGEITEKVTVRGTGHAVGELLTCPLCLDVWVATGLSAGVVFAPGLTRLVTVAFSAVTASDVLQLGYDAAKALPRRAEPG